ncbi:unnamed protein product [Effrenium voratum]|nr:unnamed protein product [Effrenium voratum]
MWRFWLLASATGMLHALTAAQMPGDGEEDPLHQIQVHFEEGGSDQAEEYVAEFETLTSLRLVCVRRSCRGRRARCRAVVLLAACRANDLARGRLAASCECCRGGGKSRRKGKDIVVSCCCLADARKRTAAR